VNLTVLGQSTWNSSTLPAIPKAGGITNVIKTWQITDLQEASKARRHSKNPLRIQKENFLVSKFKKLPIKSKDLGSL